MRRAADEDAGAAEAARKAGALAAGRDPERAFEAFARASDLKPLDAAPRIALARLLAAKGDLEGARIKAQAAFDIAFDEADRGYAAFALGEIAEAAGDNENARVHFETARQLADSVCANDPHDPAATHDLAAARQRLAELDLREGRAPQAEAGHEAALRLLTALAERGPPDPALAADRAFSLGRLADLALNAGNLPRARRRAEEADSAYSGLADRIAHSDAGLNAARAQIATLRAEIARRDGAMADARRETERALAFQIKGGAPAQRLQLAQSWRRHADILAESGEARLAAAARTQARALAEAAFQERSGDDAAGRNLLGVLLRNGAAELAEGALEAARLSLKDAVTLADSRLAAQPKDAQRMTELAAAWEQLADVAQTAQKPQAALDALYRAHHIAQMAAQAQPSHVHAIRHLALIALKLGVAASALQQHETARGTLEQSFKLRLKLADAAKGAPNALRDLAIALEHMGLAALAAGDKNAARAAWEDELALAGRIWEEPTPEGLRFCAIVRAHLASLNAPDALDHRKAALDALEQIASVGALTEADTRLRKRLQGAS